jgi:type II secretory pathway pseudopilin PulG
MNFRNRTRSNCRIRSADLQSAVSQICNLHQVTMPAAGNLSTRSACNSAIRQIANLRYARRNAFTLIECLVYMSLLFVLIGLGYMAMYRSMDASTGLRRNASDITQALNAGERWREDVRSATQALRVELNSDQETILHIPRADTEVSYRFASNTVSRRVGSTEWSLALEHVKNSIFISDPRTKVTAWKWEVELLPYRKGLTHLPPLFTFLAVPVNTAAK